MRKVCHVISGLGDGGAEALVFRLCSVEAHWKHVVISLTGRDKYFSLLRDLDIEVHTVGMTGQLFDEIVMRIDVAT